MAFDTTNAFSCPWLLVKHSSLDTVRIRCETFAKKVPEELVAQLHPWIIFPSSAASTISHSLVAASQLQQGCSEVELRQKSICIDGTHSYITLKHVEQSCIPATCESGFSKHFHKILQKRPEF